MSSRKARRLGRLSASLLALLVALWPCPGCVGVPSPRHTEDTLAKEINADLPHGTTREEVEDWLERKGFHDRSYHPLPPGLPNMEGIPDLLCSSEGRPCWEDLGVPTSEIDGYLLARKRDVKRGFWVSWDIQIAFAFNKESKLACYRMSSIGRGP